jgi:hypothetical protein
MKLTTLLFIAIGVLILFWVYSTWHKPNLTQQQQTKKTEYITNITALQNDLVYEQKTQNAYNNRRTTMAKQLAISKKLGKLYRDGIPDKYNTNGNKVKGIAPVPVKSINYYQMSHRLGNPYGLMKIARIYHYGMHNLEPDWNKAVEVYQQIVKTSSEANIREKAAAAIKELQTQTHSKKVHNWLNLPYSSNQKKKYEYNNTNKKNTGGPNSGIFGGFFSGGRGGKIKQPSRQQHTNPNANAIHVNALFRANDIKRQAPQAPQAPRGVIRNPNGGRATTGDEEDTLPVHQRNDMHNVHDSGVLGTIRKSINNLQQSTKIEIPLTSSLKGIRDLIFGLPNNDKKKDANLALDAMERSFLPLSSTNIKEVDALHLVWNRIHDNVNKDNKKALKENLMEELAECIEHDKPVCSTGRFTRILDTLNAVDPAVQIKPMYALKNEMMDKCAVIRKSLYDALPEPERVHVDGTHENEFQTNFTDKVKEQIKSQMGKDYVNTQVLTQDQLDGELNKWIDHI